jgi:hypothetical protein
MLYILFMLCWFWFVCLHPFIVLMSPLQQYYTHKKFLRERKKLFYLYIYKEVYIKPTHIYNPTLIYIIIVIIREAIR